MDIKVNYAGIIKRVVACVVDQLIFLHFYSLFYLLILFISSGEPITDILNYAFSDTDSDTTIISERYEILKDLDLLLENVVYIVLEALMVMKLGWTPGKLLCGIRIRDANTLENVSFMQVVIRSTLRQLLWIPSYIFEWFLLLPALILMSAISNQCKQTFYDKIAKTAVMDYKPEERHLTENYLYVGIIRRAIAYIIDRFIIIQISPVFFYFAKMPFDSATSKLLIICLLFVLSMMFEIFMIRIFSWTPGQLLCRIRIKNANTLESITLMQATTRYVLLEIISFILSSLFVVDILFFDKDTSKWWFGPLSSLTFTAIILIFVFAIFDKRKQFVHDKIARTVAIDYKFLS